jgi:SpoVK/Ycf46/Vps4 family AAA+-type ATPase
MNEELFEVISAFPDPESMERYRNLVGLDRIKELLERESEALLRPDLLEKWSKDKHGSRLPVLDLLMRRPPLFIFAGDVGTGKTELAMTFGDHLARKTGLPVELFCLSLRARGNGAVGEMTRLISDAFRQVRASCPKPGGHGKKPTGATILLIDEADSLAQSRALAQMHHEDRAGVNALIRGIDDIATAKLPCLTIMCSNRLGALDPAVRRRAAATFEFRRPTLEIRQNLLAKHLSGAGLSEADFAAIASVLGETESRFYGYTFSDITQRFIPSLILAAYPTRKLTRELALQVAEQMEATPPFKEASNGS